MMRFGVFDGRIEYDLRRPRSASPRIGTVIAEALAMRPYQSDANRKSLALPFDRQEVQMRNTFVHFDASQVVDIQVFSTIKRMPDGAPPAPHRDFSKKRPHRRSQQQAQKIPLSYVQIAKRNELGSRSVQDDLKTPLRQQIIDDFKTGNMLEMACDKHAHHVLRSMIADPQEEDLDHEKSVEFMAQGLADHGCEAARHKYGCRVLVAMLANRLRSQPFTKLYGEVLAVMEMSLENRYMTFVLQTMLEHGTADEQRRIVDWLSATLKTHEGAQVIAKPKNKVEKESIFTLVVALTRCKDLAGPLATALVDNIELVRELAERRKYGAVLLRALLLFDCHGPEIGAALRGIEKATLSILMKKIGRPCKDCERKSRRCQMAADAGTLLKKALAFE